MWKLERRESQYDSILHFALCLTPDLFSSNMFLLSETGLYQAHFTILIERKFNSSFIAPINPK